VIRPPVLRAAVISLGMVPIAAAAQAALLAFMGYPLDVVAFVVAVLVPIGVRTAVTGLVFSLTYGRQGLALRAAMRRLAEGDLTAGASAIPLDVERDVIGLRDAFEAMRAELDRVLRRMAHADAQRRRLFADLAHELATPATALLGLGDTLADPDLAGGDEARRRLLRALEGETLRLSRLVEDIRDLAALDDPDVSFALERADLAAPVRAAVERFAVSPGAPIDVDARAVLADVDPHRIDQAVANLIKNARRHTPEGRRIRVSVRREGGSGVVMVEDEGPGVPTEALARLGERLYRVDEGRDRSRGGHGLGLSIVRAIVERHQGALAFEAAPAGGLRVTLRLPAAPDREA
jgi:two-component system OmpR family sensor kinase